MACRRKWEKRRSSARSPRRWRANSCSKRDAILGLFDSAPRQHFHHPGVCLFVSFETINPPTDAQAPQSFLPRHSISDIAGFGGKRIWSFGSPSHKAINFLFQVDQWRFHNVANIGVGWGERKRWHGDGTAQEVAAATIFCSNPDVSGLQVSSTRGGVFGADGPRQRLVPSEVGANRRAPTIRAAKNSIASPANPPD